jgi:hypothetical protein
VALRVKLDEDLSPLLCKALHTHEYEAFTVIQQGWGGSKDGPLWKKICAEQIYFITGDKGFGDIRRYPLGTHGGIAVLRPSNESYLEYERLLEAFLINHDLESLVGTITVVSPRSIRIRRPK